MSPRYDDWIKNRGRRKAVEHLVEVRMLSKDVKVESFPHIMTSEQSTELILHLFDRIYDLENSIKNCKDSIPWTDDPHCSRS
jgi:hypothetical protein